MDPPQEQVNKQMDPPKEQTVNDQAVTKQTVDKQTVDKQTPKKQTVNEQTGEEIDPQKAMDQAREYLSSKGKMKEVLTKISASDNRVIENAAQLVHDNPEMRRNAANMARETRAAEKVNSMHNSEKRKMLAIQQQAKLSALRKGQIIGVIVNIRGKPSSISYKKEELPSSDTYNRLRIDVNNQNLFIYCKCEMMPARSTLNTTMKNFIGKDIYGPVMVFRDDETELSIQDFKEMITTTKATITK